MAAEGGARLWRLVPSLAFADMRHEAVLSLCMVAALVAIVAPLMLLLGLRHGSIEMLRTRLVENPSYREVWPSATLHLQPDWFAEVAARSDVAFVIPTILRGASIVGIRPAGGGKVHNVDLIPTAVGDPLLQTFGAAVPDRGKVVLSKPAAELTGVRTGEKTALVVTRHRGGRREKQTLTARVTAVLAFEADGLERVYAPAEVVTAVERYREGLAVPAFGWPGGKPSPHLTFDGLVLVLPRALTPIEIAKLRIGTGVSQVEAIPVASIADLFGFTAPGGSSVYVAETVSGALHAANVRQVRNKLRGRGSLVLPFVRPMTFSISGRDITVFGLSIGAREAEQLAIKATPWGGFDPERRSATAYRIALPVARPSEPLQMSVQLADDVLNLPLNPVGERAVATVPVELLAMLRTGMDREIGWDEQLGQLVLGRASFSGFRLYTETIDQVPALYRDLVAEGLRVDAHVQEIERIQVLDRGLMRLFLVIAAVGLIGGAGAIVASLYAAVERKKRDLGIMRLLGLSRRHVSTFPVYQGVALSLVAWVGAAVTFLMVASVINLSFGEELVTGGRLCRLPLKYFALTAAAILAAALMSSIIAARRATGIEPAEAIRSE